MKKYIFLLLTLSLCLVSGAAAGYLDNYSANLVLLNHFNSTGDLTQLTTGQVLTNSGSVGIAPYGQFGGASAVFSGSNYLTNTSTTALTGLALSTTQNFTLLMYLNASSYSTAPTPFATGSVGNSGSTLQLEMDSSGKVKVCKAGVSCGLTSTNGVPTGGSHQLVITRISGTEYIYIDGVANGSASDGNSYSQGGVTIGARSDATLKFTGSIDEVAFWNTVVPIAELYPQTYEVGGAAPVGEHLTADFVGTPSSGDSPLNVTFVGTQTGGDYIADSWSWDFGDGISADPGTQNISHTYTEAGVTSYSPKMKVTNTSNGYTIWVNKTNYITFNTGFNRQDLVMDPYFTLKVTFVDSATNLPIPKVLVTDSMEHNTTTGAGVFTQSYPYSTITIYATADGYVGTSRQYVMESDREEIVQLSKVQPTSTVPSSFRYTPHLVRFIAKDYSGQPLSDIRVYAQGYESTAPDNWIYNILGLDMGTVPMTNATLTGSTSSDGSIVFMMLENVQYKVNFTSQAKGVSQEMTVYPKEDSYLVILGTSAAGDSNSNWGGGSALITRNLVANQSGNKLTFNLTYLDPASQTTSILFWVTDANKQPLYNETYSGAAHNFSYVLDPITHGSTYYYGYRASHPTYGYIAGNSLITTHSRLLAPLEYLGWDTSWYMWITVVCLIFFVALFSGTTSIYGTLLFPFWSLFFGFIGWLDWCPWEFLVGVAVLGTLAFISKMYSRVGDG